MPRSKHRTLDLPSVEVPDDHWPLAHYAMRALGVRCEDVAVAAGVTTSYVGQMLRGNRMITQPVKYATVELLGGHWTEGELFDR